MTQAQQDYIDKMQALKTKLQNAAPATGTTIAGDSATCTAAADLSNGIAAGISAATGGTQPENDAFAAALIHLWTS